MTVLISMVLFTYFCQYISCKYSVFDGSNHCLTEESLNKILDEKLRKIQLHNEEKFSKIGMEMDHMKIENKGMKTAIKTYESQCKL